MIQQKSLDICENLRIKMSYQIITLTTVTKAFLSWKKFKSTNPLRIVPIIPITDVLPHSFRVLCQVWGRLGSIVLFWPRIIQYLTFRKALQKLHIFLDISTQFDLPSPHPSGQIDHTHSCDWDMKQLEIESFLRLKFMNPQI